MLEVINMTIYNTLRESIENDPSIPEEVRRSILLTMGDALEEVDAQINRHMDVYGNFLSNHIDTLNQSELNNSMLLEGKEYIPDPSYAPPGVTVEEGPKGGYYYESNGDASIADWEDRQKSPFMELKENYKTLLAGNVSPEDFFKQNAELLTVLYETDELYPTLKRLHPRKDVINTSWNNWISERIESQAPAPALPKEELSPEQNLDRALTRYDPNDLTPLYYLKPVIQNLMKGDRLEDFVKGHFISVPFGSPSYRYQEEKAEAWTKYLQFIGGSGAEDKPLDFQEFISLEKREKEIAARHAMNPILDKYHVPDNFHIGPMAEEEVKAIMSTTTLMPSIDHDVNWNVYSDLDFRVAAGSRGVDKDTTLAFHEELGEESAAISLRSAQSIKQKLNNFGQSYTVGGLTPFNTGQYGDTVERTYQYIIAHEYSHTLDISYAYKKSKQGDAFSDSMRWVYLCVHEDMPSEYAKTNTKEAFAECCALMAIKPNKFKELYPHIYGTITAAFDWNPAGTRVDLSLEEFGILPLVVHYENGVSFIGLPEQVTRDSLGNVIKVPNESESGTIGKSGIVKGERSISGLSSYWLLENGQMIKSVVAYDDDEAEQKLLKG